MGSRGILSIGGREVVLSQKSPNNALHWTLRRRASEFCRYFHNWEGSMIRTAVLVSILTGILLTASYSNAGERNPTALLGADLIEVCTSADPEIMGFCHGYIQGVYDVMSDELCAPFGVSRASIAAALVDLLHSNTETRNLHASALVLAILKNSFPCE